MRSSPVAFRGSLIYFRRDLEFLSLSLLRDLERISDDHDDDDDDEE